MQKKLYSLIIFMLLIFTVISINVFAYSKEDSEIIDEEINEGLWFVRGLFNYLDEDEQFIYLRIIAARLTGLSNGLIFYSLRFPISIKISKPFYGFLPTGAIPLLGLGFCNKWEYIESDLIKNLNDNSYDKIILNHYHIELDGYFNRAHHLLFFKNPVSNLHSIMMSFIRFKDADISINNDEFCNNDDGILFICFYNGLYDHDSKQDTLVMDGDAFYLKVLLL
jgi:hypothetical protein